MNGAQSTKIMNSMLEFIRQHGNERVAEIKRQTQEDFVVQKEQLIQKEKQRLTNQFNKDLSIAEINLKIEKSAEQNKERIERMKAINELVEGLQKQAADNMQERLSSNEGEYAQILKQLLIQGLIKLIEPKVILRCRESDVDALEGVIDEAVSEYKELMLSQVKALEGKDDIPCAVTVDKNKFLPEFNQDDPTNSCLGGFVMYAKKNRIVCSQTLDDRLAMTYQQAIPQIRALLFPCLAKKKGE